VSTDRRPVLLRRCLDGVARQTLPRHLFEVIVVDDAPDDPAEAVVEPYRSVLDVHYVAHPVNRGLGEARSTGVARASGEVVLFFDDDDVPGRRLLREHLRMHEVHREETDAVLGFTGVHPDVSISPALYHALVVGQQYFSYPALDEHAVAPWHCGWGGRTSYKTSLLRRCAPRGRWLEDTDLNARLRELGLKVHYTRSAVQYLTDSLNDVQLYSRARQLGASAAKLLRGRGDAQLTALMGGAQPEAKLRDLSPLVPRAESITGLLADKGLPGLRRATLLVDGNQRIAEELLHQAYSILLAEANLTGRVIEESRSPDGRPTFAALPNWNNTEALASLVGVFLNAFDSEDASAAELFLCLPVGPLAPEGALDRVNEIVARLGHDPRTVAPIRILTFSGTEAEQLDAIWLRAEWGEPSTPGPSIRVVEGADVLRRAAGLNPRSEALK
jgi:hypothetical protein